MMRSYDLSVMIMMMMMMCVCEHSVIRSQENRLNDHRQLFYCAAYYYQLSRDTLFICNGLFCICADIFFTLNINYSSYYRIEVRLIVHSNDIYEDCTCKLQ